MFKKLLLTLVSFGILLLLSGCVSATCSSSLVIENAEGAGTRTLVFEIAKDAQSVFYATKKDDGTLNFDKYYIYNNSTYFPKGYQAFADYVLSQLPDEGYTVTVDEDDQNYVYIKFSYSFDSFEEYAKKTKTIMGEDKWEKGEFAEPMLYVSKVTDEESENYGKLALTFAESRGVGEAIMAELLETGFSSAAVEAGVFTPYGDSFYNPDCLFAYDKFCEDYIIFSDFAYSAFLALPSAVCRFNSINEYSFIGKTCYSADDNSQLTLYVKDNGSYELTCPIPKYLGTPSFDIINEADGVSGLPMLKKYAPGEDSLAALPNQSDLYIVITDSHIPVHSQPVIPESNNSDETMNKLIIWSVYVLCICIAIGIGTIVFKKIRKVRRCRNDKY